MKIISGGQTGVDIAALKVAVKLGYPYGGWVPKGRTNEDGRISDEFVGLQETSTADTSERTVLNVRDADAVLVLTDGSRSDGTSLAIEEAQRLSIPYLTVSVSDENQESSALQIVEFLSVHRPKAVNIAGPRESEANGIYDSAHRVLERALCSILECENSESDTASELEGNP